MAQVAIGLHLFACDRTGNCAVVETKENRIFVTNITQLGPKVLANRPYAEDRVAQKPSAWKRYLGLDHGTSPQRFQTAQSELNSHPNMSISEVFDLLNQVKLDNLTKWQLVWEPSENQLYYRFPGRLDVIQVMKLMPELPCSGPPKAYPIGLMVGIFAPWNSADIASARQAATRQLGSSALAGRLGERIAAATNSARCVDSK
jgi:hypothetical protein